MNKKILISFIALSLLLTTAAGFCDEDKKNLDKGLKIFQKNKKEKKIKVKPKKIKKEFQPSNKVQEEYSIPLICPIVSSLL